MTLRSALSIAMLFAAPLASAQTVELISLNRNGLRSNGASYSPEISADGRYLAFGSLANDLVAGDTNGQPDIFVHDRVSGATVCASVTPFGVPGNGFCHGPAISGDGRFVAFHSDASDLVASDTNGLRDVFVRDMVNGTTVIASVDSNGVLSNNLSSEPSLSGDGRFVAFQSYANNLVPNDTNGLELDVFVRDLVAGQTTRVSVDSSGGEGDLGSALPSISADGTRVVFVSSATNLVPGDTNGLSDVFGHDRVSGQTVRLSVGPGGLEANHTSTNPAISADGLFAAFESNASNLVAADTNNQGDIFVVDLTTRVVSRVSVDSAGIEGNAFSRFPDISAGGRFVSFGSHAFNLVPNDNNLDRDIFVHDRMSGVTTRVSTDAAGNEGDGWSLHSTMTADGREVTFESLATNLVPVDTNNERDVFVRDRITLSFVGTPSMGSPAHFELSDAFGESGHTALVVISCSGTSGIPLPGGKTLPLTVDSCLVLGLKLSALLSGVIDAQGFAATPTVPFPSAQVGLTIYGAGVTVDTVNGVFESVTGPISFVTQ
ncbi:MAG: calcium-binding protein [Planctomycetota bacterium]